MSTARELKVTQCCFLNVPDVFEERDIEAMLKEKRITEKQISMLSVNQIATLNKDSLPDADCVPALRYGKYIVTQQGQIATIWLQGQGGDLQQLDSIILQTQFLNLQQIAQKRVSLNTAHFQPIVGAEAKPTSRSKSASPVSASPKSTSPSSSKRSSPISSGVSHAVTFFKAAAHTISKAAAELSDDIKRLTDTGPAGSSWY